MADLTTIRKICLLSSENVFSLVEKDAVDSILEKLDLQLFLVVMAWAELFIFSHLNCEMAN